MNIYEFKEAEMYGSKLVTQKILKLNGGQPRRWCIDNIVRGESWAYSFEILVFSSPTDYKLTYSRFTLLNWDIF